jgi:hypothetical protein
MDGDHPKKDRHPEAEAGPDMGRPLPVRKDGH